MRREERGERQTSAQASAPTSGQLARSTQKDEMIVTPSRPRPRMRTIERARAREPLRVEHNIVSPANARVGASERDGKLEPPGAERRNDLPLFANARARACSTPPVRVCRAALPLWRAAPPIAHAHGRGATMVLAYRGAGVEAHQARARRERGHGAPEQRVEEHRARAAQHDRADRRADLARARRQAGRRRGGGARAARRRGARKGAEFEAASGEAASGEGRGAAWEEGCV